MTSERDPQFDERYRQQPVYSRPAGLAARRHAFAGRMRDSLRAPGPRLPVMEWFETAMAEPVPDGIPAVGYYCHTVPPEIIAAGGARPVRLDCGDHLLAQQGDEWLSGEVCPLVKGAYAAVHDPDSPAARCAALVVPAACDAKRKLGELLADYRPVFTLNLPAEQDARAYGPAVAAELERLADFLGSTLARPVTRADLLAEIRAGEERTALLRQLMKERADRPGALSFRDAQLVIQSLHAGADPDRWTAQARAVLEHVRGFRAERPRLRPRLVMTGAPFFWPNFKLLNLVEECGADIVADTLCSGFQSVADPVRFDETGRSALLRALAGRYIFSSPCPCFISQGTRLGRVLELVAAHRADGVIHHGLRLCPLFDMEVPRLAAVLRERNIPLAVLRTDYAPEDTEQLRVRLEAFLETVGE